MAFKSLSKSNITAHIERKFRIVFLGYICLYCVCVCATLNPNAERNVAFPHQEFISEMPYCLCKMGYYNFRVTNVKNRKIYTHLQKL